MEGSPDNGVLGSEPSIPSIPSVVAGLSKVSLGSLLPIPRAGAALSAYKVCLNVFIQLKKLTHSVVIQHPVFKQTNDYL